MNDPVNEQLDVIARLLESYGFALEVDYPGAVIIVWAENWPLLIKIKRPNLAHSEISR